MSVKPIGKASVDTHVRHAERDLVAGRAFGEHQRRARRPRTSSRWRRRRSRRRRAPTRRCAPLGRNSPVASVSSLPSRAAIAAPSRPTHSVRFSVNGAAPGMPVLVNTAQRDLGQRQQHDAAEGERGEDVLGANRDGPHLDGFTSVSSGTRLALGRPHRRCRPAPCVPRIVFTKASASVRKLGRRLRIERRHRQAASLHRGDRVGVELGRVAEQSLLGVLRRGDARSADRWPRSCSTPRWS